MGRLARRAAVATGASVAVANRSDHGAVALAAEPRVGGVASVSIFLAN
jgi:hypothetical protein